jgi:TetR/AcrR family transcriptional regulator
MKVAKVEARRGRTHNAEKAREAILKAAEQVFSERGFTGARIDDIAEASGYNKGLIFRYFGDKPSLYLEILRQVDADTRQIQTRVVASLMEENILHDPRRVTALVKTFIGEVFDYYLQHPRVMRILLWEMAEGWQNYRQIAWQIDDEDFEKMKPFLARLQEAGLLRSEFDPLAQIITAIFQPILIMGLLPFYPIFSVEGERLVARDMRPVREFVIEFVAGGLLAGATDTNPETKKW